MGSYGLLPDGVHGALTLADFPGFPLAQLSAYGLSGGEIVASQNPVWTPVIAAGQKISAQENFESHAVFVGGNRSSADTQTVFDGPWQNITNGFFGFKFLISGEVHYGWGRISTHDNCYDAPPHIMAVLTGYAYETIPGRRILAGQTVGADDQQATNAEPSTLGFLALGAAGLPRLRRGEHKLGSGQAHAG